MMLGRGLKKISSGLVLYFFFLFIKLRKRFNVLREFSSLQLLIKLNPYIYRVTIVGIILATIIFNLSVRTINAEALAPTILFNSITGATNESSTILIEEGPLNRQASQEFAYDSANELDLSSETTLIEGPPNTDDDDFYTTTGDEGALIAPIITDVNHANPSRNKIEKYAVQSGDTISEIAQKFDVSQNTILWQNNLTWTSVLSLGQELSILPVNGIAHTVQKGDTVNQIAKKYQASTSDIVEQNKLADISDIREGEVLIVPDGVQPAKVAVKNVSQKSLPTIIKEIFAPQTAPADLGTKLLWPILSHRITQYYNFRHTGLDIGDKTGDPIYAAESGRVERAGWNRGGYGNHVIINHGNSIETLYGHASKILVKVGDVVSRGQIIALIGSTGRSTGPHLHLEVRINGTRVNPLNYIR